ncbi:MAG: lytic transglycosylase domain-containing protein [Candidatus Tectomicrobia bacterium]|nr:lytic transglycosylase domain-containing protein [Candidatus Tectomicrobia bacterium]
MIEENRSHDSIPPSGKLFVYKDSRGATHLMMSIFTSSVPVDLPQQPSPLENLISFYADRYGISPNLVKAVILAESRFSPSATSRKGAQGLMQLMPSTSDFLNVVDPFDPSQNLEGGIKYLRFMLDRFEQNLPLALAAYNAGPGKVSQYRGIPPYAETQAYVNTALAEYTRLSSQKRDSQAKVYALVNREGKIVPTPIPTPDPRPLPPSSK